MEVHIYSNVVRQRYNDNTRRPKSKENQLGILKTCILPENSAEGFGSRREYFWGYISIDQNAPKKWPHLSP